MLVISTWCDKLHTAVPLSLPVLGSIMTDRQTAYSRKAPTNPGTNGLNDLKWHISPGDVVKLHVACLNVFIGSVMKRAGKASCVPGPENQTMRDSAAGGPPWPGFYLLLQCSSLLREHVMCCISYKLLGASCDFNSELT